MSRKVAVAACQSHVRPVRHSEEFARHAAEPLEQTGEADLVLFPELFTMELFTTLRSLEEPDPACATSRGTRMAS